MSEPFFFLFLSKNIYLRAVFNRFTSSVDTNGLAAESHIGKSERIERLTNALFGVFMGFVVSKKNVE